MGYVLIADRRTRSQTIPEDRTTYLLRPFAIAEVFVIYDPRSASVSSAIIWKPDFNASFFLKVTEMSINELSHETFEDLCNALERGPSVTWKTLMGSTLFRSIYTENVAAMINCSKDLLDDMAVRKIKLQDLLTGFKEIGNWLAVSILMKGLRRSGLDIPLSGGRPPPGFSTAWDLEYEQCDTSFSSTQRRELAETLSYPVQESEAAESASHPSETGFKASLNVVETVVSTFFPCVFEVFFTKRLE